MPDAPAPAQPEAVPTPILVSSSAFQTIATAVLRQLITAAGAGLVARGIVTQGQVDADTPQLVGLAMVAGSAAWAWWKANRTHGQLATVAADPRVPDDVAKLKP